MNTGVTMMTTGGVPVGTRQVASLHQRAVVRTTTAYVTSSVVEMHAVRSKASTENESVMN
jgi:hypothetical protein